MSIICPTVLAENPHTFREQLDRIAPFAKRIQIDLADGQFAPNETIKPIQSYWPDGILADIHLMYQLPDAELETLISLEPHMVIVHAEAEGDIVQFMKELQAVGIKAGVALLKDSQPETYASFIEQADHVLLFSGDLGHFGGTADLTVANKIDAIKKINPSVEIGWDGGVNDENAHELSQRGVDVLNVGGFIQKAEKPQEAYATIVGKINA